MQSFRVPFLPLLLFTAVTACSGDSPAQPSAPVPQFLVKVGGDNQSGRPGTTLTQPLEVRITDVLGVAISGFAVTFSTTGGSLSPETAQTDLQGRARTVLTLPAQSGTVVVTAAGAGLAPVTFSAESIHDPIVLGAAFLPAARRGLPYSRTLTASGGSGSGYTFEVATGALPPGLILGPDGVFAGTPTATGAFPVSIRVRDGAGGEVSRTFTMNVCDLPEAMSVGEVRTFAPTSRGGCGVFFPSGSAGARYRVAVVRTSHQPLAEDVAAVSLYVSGNGVVGGSAPPLLTAPRPAAIQSAPAPGLLRAARAMEARRRGHLADLTASESLARRLGMAGLLADRPPARVEGPAPLPDRLRLDPNTPAGCSAGPQVTALKIAEDDVLAVYQDSAQNANPTTRVTLEQAERLIYLYTEYGKPVIDRHFGGVPDTDGNGKVILFVTPAVGEETLGKVYTGDFYSRDSCRASNEGEYVYLHYQVVQDMTHEDEGRQIGFHVVVHEIKHIASLWHRIGHNQNFHPLWVEEGGAELAAERAGRYAWSRLQGPAMHAAVEESHWRREEGTNFRTENFPVLYMLFRTQGTLSRQPNSLVASLVSAPSDYVYGAGWLFLRWLGDAYGDAASESFGDADWFRTLTEQAPSGVAGIEAATGRTWAQLMEEFATAAAVHSQGVDYPRAFTSYDFISAIEMWCFAVDPIDFARSQCPGQPGPPGAFPWPVTTDSQGASESRSFADAVFEGSIGPSGLRVHDLVSNGTGQGAEINVEVGADSRVVVVRLN